MNKDALPDFSGKCLSMRVVDSEGSHDLFDPHFEYQGGRLFLIGTIPEGASESNWDANQIGAVDWSRVRNYILFPDMDSYTECVGKSESYQENEIDE